uniref:IS5 family transposase n=2 Tax=Desertifilum tharense IPPAS B-1220 TaxID=1781255 RepID=A0ACD5GZV2_9CYAN
MRYHQLEHLSHREFKRLCGVSRGTFRAMVEELRPHLDRRGQRGGQAKLSVEDQLLVALEYWREYRTQFHIGVSWGLHETTVGRIVRKVEDVLIKCGKFRLPGNRQLYQPGWEWKVMVVDVGEVEIERPQKTQKRYYSGKQKCHTLKAQLLVEFETGQVICTAVDTGRTHDFKLLKRSRLPLKRSQLCLADRGYQGFAKLHTGACIPTKKRRKQPLPAEEKQHNQALARLRVRVEHVIRRFKIFRIFSGRYRNRRRRFGLRLNLIAGLLNYELTHVS